MLWINKLGVCTGASCLMCLSEFFEENCNHGNKSGLDDAVYPRLYSVFQKVGKKKAICMQ